MKFLLPIVLLMLTTAVWAQEELVTIKSNRKNIDIRDNKILKKRTWRILPECELDIYTTTSDRVVFYTDVDSMVIELEEGEHFDFAIKLKNNPRAVTRVVRDEPRLKKLKAGGGYSNELDQSIPKFSYQSARAGCLKRVRKELKLDSIAGEGDELMQIFNLMHWLHNSVRHDGSSDNPTLKNAIDLIRICRKEQRGINCRMMAIALNECYLAMGIKSHFVTCMPKEQKFTDCHVINSVYSTQLKKWIWIDPTFAAYVTDEKGELLGIREVRERLIEDKPVLVNRDANWNHTSLRYSEQYLKVYMAKNLYRLQMPIESEYNYETVRKKANVNYVELVPKSYPKREKYTWENKDTKGSYTRYFTTNDDQFWAKPE